MKPREASVHGEQKEGLSGNQKSKTTEAEAGDDPPPPNWLSSGTRGRRWNALQVSPETVTDTCAGQEHQGAS